jgi:hypothetical protein
LLGEFAATDFWKSINHWLFKICFHQNNYHNFFDNLLHSVSVKGPTRSMMPISDGEDQVLDTSISTGQMKRQQLENQIKRRKGQIFNTYKYHYL